MNKVLITGGLGFIFSHVTEYFVKLGYKVVVIDNKSVGSHPEIIDGSFDFIEADVSDEKIKQVIIDENPEYIIHAAAITDVDTSINNPQKVVRNNVMATLNIFDAARKVTNLKKLLYVNTDEVYGQCETKKGEEDLLFPRNPYSSSKAFGALLRYSYDNTFPELKDKTTEIRMCNIFGERQDMRKIMPQIIESIRGDHSIPLQEEGVGYREYLYVKNVAPLIETILLAGNRTYNITNNDGYTVKELFSIVKKITGKDVKTHPAGRPGHDRIYQMSNDRIVKEFYWKPVYTFDEGLKRYLENEGIKII